MFCSLHSSAVSALVVCVLLGVAACDRPAAPYQPTYSNQRQTVVETTLTFAVHPLHSPQHLAALYQPLVDQLQRRLPDLKFRLEASSSYPAYEQKLREQRVALALPNPYQTLLAERHGYRVIAKVADDEDFRGLILLRRNSPVRSPGDLAGKAVSFPAPTALAATLLPQRWLHDQGVSMQSIDARYVGTQESSILNVALGKTVAAATWPQAWRTFSAQQPDLASQLVVRWKTPALINNSVMVRADVDEKTASRLSAALVDLSGDDEGRQVLRQIELKGFEVANGRTYDRVRTFLRDFERDVRKVEGP
jgi:phosphonate transport system substrate-binding protein